MTNGKENEDKDCPSVFMKFNPWIKFGAGLLSLILLIGGVLWGMTATFAMKPEIIAVEQKVIDAKVEIREDIQLTAGTLLQTIQQDRKNADIRFYRELNSQSVNEERKIRNQLQQNPNDQFLINQLQEELRKQKQYQDKLNKLLETF